MLFRDSEKVVLEARMNKLDLAHKYYKVAVRMRTRAAEIEDEARREVKDKYERKLQDALDRYQDALRAHPVGR